ncbi:MAG: PatB family C-S lyase [Candidatus Izemoplasmatales bacterium]|nr:PatB family C-S lyase [Candidatus Izemoplasmatales bacterium]MDD3865465.1 PatB family C-S lyase [Candidatus Izemoplasmatales bacterium]
MKRYNFNKIICRKDTNSVKYDLGKGDDCLSMWIADMDFPVADEIVKALKKRVNHPIYGYSYIPDDVFDAFINWQKTRNGIAIKKADIIPYYSVVAGINLLLNIFTEPNDNITIMSPVYNYFWTGIKNAKRNIVASPLINSDGYYLIDFANLDLCLQKSKVLLLCSPHNPVGRVWSEGELKKIAALAEKNHVLVISDEIHSDLIMPGFKHVPFSTVNERIKDSTFTLLSATKTFNIAATGMSFLVSENPEHIKQINEAMCQYHLGAQNVFAPVMVNAAFQHGAAWLDQVIKYIEGNYQLVKTEIEAKMPKISLPPLEGTYLLWLDCRKLKKCVCDFFETEAKVLGEDGSLFGENGAKFYRINIATPRKNIRKMLARLEEAYRLCEK